MSFIDDMRALIAAREQPLPETEEEALLALDQEGPVAQPAEDVIHFSDEQAGIPPEVNISPVTVVPETDAEIALDETPIVAPQQAEPAQGMGGMVREAIQSGAVDPRGSFADSVDPALAVDSLRQQVQQGAEQRRDATALAEFDAVTDPRDQLRLLEQERRQREALGVGTLLGNAYGSPTMGALATKIYSDFGEFAAKERESGEAAADAFLESELSAAKVRADEADALGEAADLSAEEKEGVLRQTQDELSEINRRHAEALEAVGTTIDPRRAIKNMSAGRRIANVLAAGIFGGLAASQGRAGAPNPILQNLQRMMDRDVAAQKADMLKNMDLAKMTGAEKRLALARVERLTSEIAVLDTKAVKAEAVAMLNSGAIPLQAQSKYQGLMNGVDKRMTDLGTQRLEWLSKEARAANTVRQQNLLASLKGQKGKGGLPSAARDALKRGEPVDDPFAIIPGQLQFTKGIRAIRVDKFFEQSAARVSFVTELRNFQRLTAKHGRTFGGLDRLTGDARKDLERSANSLFSLIRNLRNTGAQFTEFEKEIEGKGSAIEILGLLTGGGSVEGSVQRITEALESERLRQETVNRTVGLRDGNGNLVPNAHDAFFVPATSPTKEEEAGEITVTDRGERAGTLPFAQNRLRSTDLKTFIGGANAAANLIENEVGDFSLLIGEAKKTLKKAKADKSVSAGQIKRMEIAVGVMLKAKKDRERLDLQATAAQRKRKREAIKNAPDSFKEQISKVPASEF